MGLKVMIVDDEPLAINVLKNYVEQVSELELAKTFSNAVDASTYLQGNEVDIIFLDINMPVLDGFDFLETIEHRPMVVITSAHEEYALKSYEAQAIDYLVKPISFPRFLKTVNRIVGLLSTSGENPHSNSRLSIFVKVDNKRLQKIYLDEILVVESLKDYIRIKTTSEKYIVHSTLSGFTEELPSEKFIRIHRSFTVSVDKIESVEGNSIEIDGIRYTVGRSYLEDFKRRVLKK
ncbi:MAG: DNA-binding response regulator [Muricauda sp.]|uniref:Two-component system response regulator protein n=1 Tax=Flagellimonas lutaonensis TaxID=516051 RepID=A0A0D5YRV8_9FLAO|nr:MULTISPECIES: response regulator transcription factor [Allomuricauda]AKA34586.1 Two-component system response regulator protein [Allomuricauda lutaonensis]MBC30605.1 DNA-binding response regulator [Allomuricauda sp.]|tara:strand:+ start:50595 stop:51296 length:702 start_codon:yes stop_codon:yes gene_type:complete